MGAKKRGWDILTRATQKLKSGGGSRPRWLEAVRSVPPPPPPPRSSHPPMRLRFVEDPLEQGFRSRNPSTKLDPVRQGQIPPARAFAIRQLQLMEQGISKEEARRAVEEEWKKRDQAAGQTLGKRTKNILEQIQEEEERELRNALLRLRASQNMPE